MILTEYKPIGITCGDFIKNYNFNKIAYVGRLDPMAHGLITILTDDDLTLMKEYMLRSKTYIFKFIIGINTDTDDILGLNISDQKNITINIEDIIKYITNHENQFNQKYHNFSSYKPSNKDIDGKRKEMWWWSSNTTETVSVPSRKVIIFNKEIKKIETINGNDFKNKIIENIKKIEDNKFRKEKIIEQWKNYNFNESYIQFECELSVSSGFYIRQFIKDMSDKLNVKLIVTDINRIYIF
jgi:tRNA pseudouridine(55) synthase